MIASAPNNFTEMVNMGMRLEEGVREGRMSRDEASTSKRYGSNFELYPSLVLKNLIQPRNPPQILEPLPWWYKPELRCAFHQGATGHDIENCYPLKYEVQKLMKSGMVSFEDRVPNVKASPLPTHGNSSVNMVDGCLGEFKVFDVRFIRRSLVQMHKDICLVSDCEHDHDGCVIFSVNPRGCDVVKRDIQRLMDEGRTGLGFQKGSSIARSEDIQLSFRSGGFIHGNEQHLAVVLEDSEKEDCTNFVTHGKTCKN
ncbi:hypothetical protein KIW84_057196 [Lathyrus oleraceus]|uniref:Gag-pol polyprotein n=1 Tax=Pisum sativum TaxID=3888 RepID=A0A9D4X2I3_PEA|nr:hypothetical protein KIW84_057196 [Pisum sativum]